MIQTLVSSCRSLVQCHQPTTRTSSKVWCRNITNPWVHYFTPTKFNIPSLKLTYSSTWKWMVGVLVSFWGPAYFQVRAVSFRECSPPRINECPKQSEPTINFQKFSLVFRGVDAKKWWALENVSPFKYGYVGFNFRRVSSWKKYQVSTTFSIPVMKQTKTLETIRSKSVALVFFLFLVTTSRMNHWRKTALEVLLLFSRNPCFKKKVRSAAQNQPKLDFIEWASKKLQGIWKFPDSIQYWLSMISMICVNLYFYTHIPSIQSFSSMSYVNFTTTASLSLTASNNPPAHPKRDPKVPELCVSWA